MKKNKYLVVVNFDDEELNQVVYTIEAQNMTKASRKAQDLLIGHMNINSLGMNVEIEIFFPVDINGEEIIEGELVLVDSVPEYENAEPTERLIKDEPLFFKETVSYEGNLGVFKKLSGEEIFASCDIFRKINQN